MGDAQSSCCQIEFSAVTPGKSPGGRKDVDNEWYDAKINQRLLF